MKNYWPRFLKPTSLFARGLLMILVPIAVLQLIIGTLIYQRYFYQVTQQLNAQVISEINFSLDQAKTKFEFEEILNKLEIYTSTRPNLTKSNFGWTDISGRLIRSNFTEAFGGEVYIDSRAWSSIQITIHAKDEILNLLIDRKKLAPINPHQIMLNTLAFSLLLVLLSILFLRNQIKSLRKLSQAAKAFGRGETLRYIPTGSDEIRSAGRSFIAMRTRISRQREHRNLMLSGVSHDLRTPLTRMKLSVEMLDDEEARDTLIEDITAIEELADSFLTYASNDAPEEFKNVELQDYLINIASNYPTSDVHGNPAVYLRIKPILFRRAIENILGNASRFSNQIKINAAIKGRVVTVCIDDNGPGIPPEKREAAIKPFTRLDPARNLDKNNHVGLGMAIAADAIRQHGGTLSLGKSALGGLQVKIDIPTKIEVI